MARYTREEVQEILRRASVRAGDEAGDGIAHEELIEAAREAGLDVSAVEDAAGELAWRRQEERAVETWRARRKRGFASHAITWGVVSVFLLLLNLVTSGFTGGFVWALFPILAWAMGLALHGASVYREPSPEKVERIARKERRRIASEARREARRASRGARVAIPRVPKSPIEEEFERVVETGVAALLGAVADKLDHASGKHLPDSEFNRYVARKQGRPIVTPAPTGEGPRVRVPGMRVDEPAPDDEDERGGRLPPRRAGR